MNITLLTRQQLEIINRKTLKYPLQIAEKDYQSEATLIIEKLQYEGILDLPNSLKVELDFLQHLDRHWMPDKSIRA